MDLDFSPYAVGGAQARSDSFTRLDPNFATGVYGLTQAAHAAGIPLQITSAYRSPPTQARIIADGMARYGLGDRADAWRADVARLGPVAAGQQWRPEMREAGLTRFIAMPGGSQHQRGTAVDFALNGSLIRDADSPAAQFIRNNAAQYGLSVPMDWEPWQVEPVGSRDGSRPQAALNFRGAPQMAMQPTQPQGLLGQLGIQRQDPTAQGETALPFYQRDRFSNTMGNLAMAFNSLRQRPDENIPRIVTGQRATREQNAAKNRTIEWFLSQPDGARYAEMAEAMGTQVAFQAYQADAERARRSAASAAELARGELREVDGRLVRVMADGTVQEIYGGDQSGEIREVDGSLVRVMPDGTVQEIYGGDQSPDVSEVGALRREFTGLAAVKSFEPVARQYANIMTSAATSYGSDGTGTGPADIALVFSFMKLIDPSSAVQQSEQANAANAGGVPARVWGYYNALRGEGTMDQATRDQFVAAATDIYNNAKTPYDTAVEYYTGLSTQLGYDPTQVIGFDRTYGGSPYVPTGTTSAPPLTTSAIDAGVTQLRWDNMTPEQRSAFP
jgi:hypothetical protein